MTFQFNDPTTTIAFIVFCVCTVWMMFNTAISKALDDRSYEKTHQTGISTFITIIFVAWTIAYGFLFDIINLSH